MLDWLNFILFVLLMLLKAFVHTMFRFNPLQQSIFERSVVPLNCYSTQQANMSTYSHYSLGFQQGLGSSGLYSFSSLLVCLFFQEWFYVCTIIQQYTVCSGGSLFPCFSAPDIICNCGDHVFKPPKKARTITCAACPCTCKCVCCTIHVFIKMVDNYSSAGTPTERLFSSPWTPWMQHFCYWAKEWSR